MTTKLSAHDPFISEIYFYSGSTNEQEAIEIAGPTGSSLEGWQLLLYDGATGLVYDSHIFGADVIFPYSVTLEEQDYGTIVQYYGVSGIQDGLVDGDGVALVNPEGLVTKFLSYGGQFLASDGPAIGLVSTTIGDVSGIINEGGTFSFLGRCPLLTFCGPNDEPYFPSIKELEKLKYWLEFLGAYRKPMVCGVYNKANQAEGNPEDLIYDRFGNSYSKEELINRVQTAKNLHCHGDYESFNVRIETWTNGSNQTFPTPEQEEVVCAVFTYLDGILQTTPTGGPANILVRFDPNLIGSGVAGTGSPQFRFQCGVGYSLVQEQLNSAIQNLDPTFLHGGVDINPGLNFNTDLSDNPIIAPDEFDLYTILLHEMLHVLGFASQVGASGNTLGSFYTLWDLHLLKSANTWMINTTEAADECCLDYEFNTTAFPAMPANIMEGCGDVLFDLPNFPAINAEYNTSGGVDDALAANMLSHLDINCENQGENYVMHYDISPGPIHPDGFPNARRVLTGTEMSILCELGYTVADEGNGGNTCQPSCFLLVQDDGAFFISDEVEFIELSDILDNDVLTSAGDFEITLNETCGNTGNLSFELIQTIESDGIEITLNDTPFGTYELCYVITACDGTLCDEGVITLIATDKIDPTICLEDGDCNLVNFGNFELFPVGFNFFYPSFITPFNDNLIRFYEGGTLLFNTVDIFVANNNKYLRWVRWNTIGVPANDIVYESPLLPLCRPIPVDCNIDISFDMCLTTYENDEDFETISIWGLSTLPVNNQLATSINCNGILEDDSGNEIGICLANEFPIDCRVNTYFEEEPNDLPFSSYNINTSNNSNEIIKYIMIVGNTSKDIAYYMDNVVVQTDCQNIIEVTAIPESTCIGEQITLDVEVCLTGPDGFPASDMTIEAILPNITGISLSDNNMDFVDGIATVNNLTPPNDCENLSLMLDIGENFQEGNTLTITFEVVASNACLAGDANPTIDLVLEDCCPDQPISGFTTEGGECNPQVTFTSVDQNPNWIHSWTFGDGASSTEINPIHTYTEADTYTITHTVTNDCGTNTTQGTIEVFNSFITADFTYEQENCETLISFFSAETSEVEHLWNFNGLGISEMANPSFDFPSAGTYTVSHTITGNCGTESSSQTVTITECLEFCPDEEGIRMGEDENSFTVVTQAIMDGILNDSGKSSDQSFIINGTLIIDEDYEFERCHLKMGPGAAIIVKQHTTLTLEGNAGLSGNPFNSTLTACDYLWKGINLDADAILDMRGTYIADAQYAIRAYNRTDLNLVYNTFDRNFVGLYVPAADFNQGLANFTAFFNRFNCSNNLNPVHPTIDLLPIPDGIEILDWAYAGLWLNDLSTFSMGSTGSTSASNIFNNLVNGIITKNTTLSIFSTQFLNINPHAPYTIRAYGVYGTGTNHSLLLRGMGMEGTASFENCRNGIRTSGMNVNIFDNRMERVDGGILVVNENSLDIRINENHLECEGKGIIVSQVPFITRLHINDNDIIMNTQNTLPSSLSE